ncbi:MAG: hypothetical protein NUV77_23005 [Thermoguttaceae bacterium]|jgi:hypothetical protein|nr:hypothetical protein [Thermoguttaceae bacterium]
MFGMEVGQVKRLFFDTERVVRATDKAQRRVLSKFGAYVRRGAKSSIRKRRAPSPPGTPPSSHTGVLKRFIFFAYEPERHNVVIGPAKTNQVFFDRDRRPVRGTVPSVLEYGGQVTVLEVHRHGRWQRADLRSRRRMGGRPMRYRKVTIAARPYMHPAFERERPKLPAMWKNSVR